MQFKKKLEIKANHKQVVIDVADILYIKASVNDCYIHVTSGSVYKTRSTLEAMEAQVGEYFLKVHRTYLENFLSMTYKIDADDRIHELLYGCEPKAV